MSFTFLLSLSKKASLFIFISFILKIYFYYFKNYVSVHVPMYGLVHVNAGALGVWK